MRPAGPLEAELQSHVAPAEGARALGCEGREEPEVQGTRWEGGCREHRWPMSSQVRGVARGLCGEPAAASGGTGGCLEQQGTPVPASRAAPALPPLPFLPRPGGTFTSLSGSERLQELCALNLSLAQLFPFCTPRALVGGTPGVGVSLGDWEARTSPASDPG